MVFFLSFLQRPFAPLCRNTVKHSHCNTVRTSPCGRNFKGTSSSSAFLVLFFTVALGTTTTLPYNVFCTCSSAKKQDAEASWGMKHFNPRYHRVCRNKLNHLVSGKTCNLSIPASCFNNALALRSLVQPRLHAVTQPLFFAPMMHGGRS